MTIKQLFQGVCRKIYGFFYDRSCRRRIRNTDFTIIAPNCYAGIMYHRLGMRFTSPTINCYFPVRKEYLEFCSNLKYYLEQDIHIEFSDQYEGMFPVGNIDGIHIVFNHYKTCELAYEKWNKRKQLVNYDNLFFIFDDIADAEYEDLVKFNTIPCRGKVIFTAKKYPALENTVVVSKFAKSGIMRHYLIHKNPYTGKYPTDQDFDFVDWLNGKGL